jgi:uncharacterized protein (TIGR00251 family)
MQTVATVELLVKPRSKHDRIAVDAAGVVSVAVTSPPHDGKANRHVTKLIARTLRVPQSRVSIVRGAGSRHKVVDVDGMTREQILSRIRSS